MLLHLRMVTVGPLDLLLTRTVARAHGKWLYNISFVVSIRGMTQPSVWDEAKGLAEVGSRCVRAVVVNGDHRLERSACE